MSWAHGKPQYDILSTKPDGWIPPDYSTKLRFFPLSLNSAIRFESFALFLLGDDGRGLPSVETSAVRVPVRWKSQNEGQKER